MTAVYYASITDHKGLEVVNLEYTASAKHSAFLAIQFVENCPPAIGFKIHKYCVDRKGLVHLLNENNN